MVSSPAAPRRKPAKKLGHDGDGDEAFDEFVISDNEDNAFEPLPRRRQRREETPQLGPPITTDEKMASLPGIHRVFVTQFIEAAKGLDEKIRNKAGLRRPLFTEANFREMAIVWTVTLDDMMQIQDINVDRVKTYGPQFIPLLERFSQNYNRAFNDQDDRVIDKRENVIDLVSDEEDYDDGDEDEDEEAVLEAEQGSKYFAKPQYGSGSKAGKSWAAGAKSASSRGRGGSYRGKGRGGKRSFSRKSNGSASAQSSSGVSKRKFSGGAKKSRASKAGGSSSSKGSSIMRNFGNQGGGGSMGGGGIGMMPT